MITCDLILRFKPSNKRKNVNCYLKRLDNVSEKKMYHHNRNFYISYFIQIKLF